MNKQQRNEGREAAATRGVVASDVNATEIDSPYSDAPGAKTASVSMVDLQWGVFLGHD